MYTYTKNKEGNIFRSNVPERNLKRHCCCLNSICAVMLYIMHELNTIRIIISPFLHAQGIYFTIMRLRWLFISNPFQKVFIIYKISYKLLSLAAFHRNYVWKKRMNIVLSITKLVFTLGSLNIHTSNVTTKKLSKLSKSSWWVWFCHNFVCNY